MSGMSPSGMGFGISFNMDSSGLVSGSKNVNKAMGSMGDLLDDNTAKVKSFSKTVSKIHTAVPRKIKRDITKKKDFMKVPLKPVLEESELLRAVEILDVPSIISKFEVMGHKMDILIDIARNVGMEFNTATRAAKKTAEQADKVVDKVSKKNTKGGIFSKIQQDMNKAWKDH